MSATAERARHTCRSVATRAALLAALAVGPAAVDAGHAAALTDPSGSRAAAVGATANGPRLVWHPCREGPAWIPVRHARGATRLRASGRVIGPFWTWDYEPCSTWPVRSAHRYEGPWDRRTANPILVIGNTFDPATPLRGAVAMTGQLARARLLILEGYGHTALLNPSSCVDRREGRYLIRGSLPPVGTRCAQDGTPFGG